jgi:hypothetical protein
VVSTAATAWSRSPLAEIGRIEDDPTDRLAGLAEQMDWLRDAGFGEVDCHFKWLELALMIAVKESTATT